MSLIIKLKNPEMFLLQLQNRVKENKIKLWEIDSIGNLIHTPKRFINKAWFKPHIDIEKEEIVFKYMNPVNEKNDKLLYGIYHGRLLKMVMSDFYKKFDIISAEIIKENNEI